MIQFLSSLLKFMENELVKMKISFILKQKSLISILQLSDRKLLIKVIYWNKQTTEYKKTKLINTFANVHAY